MKTRLVRRDPIQGFDITQVDHGRATSLLKAARNCVLTNDRGAKRLGFDRYNTRLLTRGMMMQRRSYEGAYLHVNGAASSDGRISRVDYPSLGYGFLRWHADYQPTRAADYSIDWRVHTGNFDSSRSWYYVDCAADRGGTQWTDIRSALTMSINTSGKLVIRITREGGAIASQTLTSTTTLTKNTEYHVGIRYTASSALVQLYINQVVDATTLTLGWLGGEVWAGEASAASYPNWYFLNRLYVHREMASNANDSFSAGTPRDSYVEYPTSLECAPEGAGIYEIRVWSASKDFSSASYPANRPLTAAEIADANLKGYWPCDDGGGGSFRNAKQSNSTRPILCLPNTPMYVSDTGLSGGIGLEFADGTALTKLFPIAAVKEESLGISLWRVFGDEGVPGIAVGNTYYIGLTLQFQIRTCFSKMRRPGDPANTSYIFAVDVSGTDSYMNGTASQAGIFVVTLTNAGLLQVTDHGYSTGTVALSDETVYTVSVTRSVGGTLSIYLDANSAASTTGAILLGPSGAGDQMSVNVGHFSPWAGFRCSRNVGAAFRLGWLRLWRRELTPAERTGNALRQLTALERSDPDLLVNLEISSVTGDDVPSVCSYPALFSLAKVTNQHHLGPNSFPLGREWWDAWPNSRPVFAGNHDQTRSYDPVGAEGSCELVTAHRAVFAGTAQLATVNHGVFHIDSDLNLDWESIAPEEVAGVKEHGGHANYDRVRAVPAADRLFMLTDKGAPKVWTGRTLSPIGIPVPYHTHLPEGNALPLIAPASGIGGSMTPSKYYSYVFEYVDDEFGVVERIGPTQAVLLSGTTSMFIGADGTVSGANTDDQRPIRRHLNPRVTSINVWRSLASDTAALAEAGPFLFRSRSLNQDIAGTDTTADSALGPDTLLGDFKRPPQSLYATILNDRLILAGLKVAPDSILPSQPGNLENFDVEADTQSTEDGTGGIATGLITAYGSAWLFKDRSLWKIDDVGAGIDPKLYTASVGCIAPNSLVEFYSPESGQRVMFFWSSEGPYIFDGTQPRAVGLPLKGDPQVEPFLDIADVSKIYVRNVEKYSQLWVFLPPRGRTAYEQIFAFDYLRGRWIEHTGMRFNDMASVTLNASNLPSYVAGGSRGRYYEVLESARDGAPAGVSSVVGTDVDATSTTTQLVTSNAHIDWLFDLRDVVVTIIHGAAHTTPAARNVQERRWIKSNTSTAIVPEEAFDYAPEAGDTWIVAGIDFRLEYPHDDLEDPTIDKHVHNLVTYNVGALFFRVSTDWDALTGPITALAASNGNRIRTYINTYGETLKLELSNPLADSPCIVHAYGFEVAPGRSTVRAE